MNKLTLFLLLALIIQVLNLKVGEYTLDTCEYMTIDGASSDKLIDL